MNDFNFDMFTDDQLREILYIIKYSIAFKKWLVKREDYVGYTREELITIISMDRN